MSEQLIDLEVKLAYQERLIRDLDELVRKFGARLDVLVREVESLKAAARSPETPVGPANEPPPHY